MAAKLMGVKVFHIGSLDEDECHQLISKLMTMQDLQS